MAKAFEVEQKHFSLFHQCSLLDIQKRSKNVAHTIFKYSEFTPDAFVFFPKVMPDIVQTKFWKLTEIFNKFQRK